MIKHAISKIEWAIKWALNYYIAQSIQKSSELAVAVELETEPHQAEGAWGPDELGSREDADKMQ